MLLANVTSDMMKVLFKKEGLFDQIWIRFGFDKHINVWQNCIMPMFNTKNGLISTQLKSKKNNIEELVHYFPTLCKLKLE